MKRGTTWGKHINVSCNIPDQKLQERAAFRASCFVLLLGSIGQLGCASAVHRAPVHESDHPEDSDHSVGEEIDGNEPRFALEVGQGPEGLVISWRRCDSIPTAFLDILTVGRLGTFALECRLEHADASRPKLNQRRWVYGSPVEGYQIAGCKALEPNVDYAVNINGDARGWASFSVLADGSIKKISEFRCR